MATKKRMVWRISDIAGAVRPRERGRVSRICDAYSGNVPEILRGLDYTLPTVCGVRWSWWQSATTEQRAAALVATAKRLGVKQVPA